MYIGQNFTLPEIQLICFIYKHLIYKMCFYQRSGKITAISEKNVLLCHLPVQIFAP